MSNLRRRDVRVMTPQMYYYDSWISSDENIEFITDISIS